MTFESTARMVIERCHKLATFSEDRGRIRRTFLSQPMWECHQEMTGWVNRLGIEARIDSVGNWRAVYPGEAVDAPRLLIGSHLDTVPNAGAYDGVLGVVLAVALLERLGGRQLPFAIEAVGFSEEEGVRFGVPFIGSRALVGRVSEELLSHKDPTGITVRQAIEDFGLDPRRVSAAGVRSDTLGYIEFHIEQGPVLDQMNRPLGVVEAIAGQSRLEVIFRGGANHAGTTPMNMRHDAVAAAAEWITAVETEAQRTPGLVATVGSVTAKPGTVNVIASEARATLDIRHGTDALRASAVEKLMRAAGEIGGKRGVSARHAVMMDQAAVAMDPALTHEAEEAIRRAGCEPHRMISGAGHDAMVLAGRVPTAMIFLRTPGGISHDPAEAVRLEDVAKAVEAGSLLLEQLAVLPARQRRTHLA